ncbi:MAG: glycosyltransferase family 4 protein [Limnobacter sp.]|nr:glycosyltransferase family 4 protein [Limnobacter sp.]
MKILQISSSPHWGGAQIRALTEAAGLRSRGHEVVIASPAGSPIGRRAAGLRIPVVELPPADGPLPTRLQPCIAMRRLVRDGGFDALATHGTIDSWLAALACASLRRAPPIVRTHHATAPVPHGPAARWLYMSAATRIVTTGESVRQSLVRDQGFDGRRIVAIPTGIDLGYFKPAATPTATEEARRALGLPDDGLPVLGTVASLRRSKGHHFLIEALAGLDRPARLLVVGDGPQRAALEKQADALLPEGRVLFAGAQAEVLPWLRALDVFVLPTLHEGVPQSLSQAMGVGLCCVTTPVGGIPEIACDGESALFVPPGEVEPLRDALQRVIDDPGLRARLGTGARAAALDCCSIEAMLDRVEALYRELVDASRERRR